MNRPPPVTAKNAAKRGPPPPPKVAKRAPIRPTVQDAQQDDKIIDTQTNQQQSINQNIQSPTNVVGQSTNIDTARTQGQYRKFRAVDDPVVRANQQSVPASQVKLTQPKQTQMTNQLTQQETTFASQAMGGQFQQQAEQNSQEIKLAVDTTKRPPPPAPKRPTNMPAARPGQPGAPRKAPNMPRPPPPALRPRIQQKQQQKSQLQNIVQDPSMQSRRQSQQKIQIEASPPPQLPGATQRQQQTVPPVLASNRSVEATNKLNIQQDRQLYETPNKPHEMHAPETPHKQKQQSIEQSSRSPDQQQTTQVMAMPVPPAMVQPRKAIKTGPPPPINTKANVKAVPRPKFQTQKMLNQNTQTTPNQTDAPQSNQQINYEQYANVKRQTPRQTNKQPGHLMKSESSILPSIKMVKQSSQQPMPPESARPSPTKNKSTGSILTPKYANLKTKFQNFSMKRDRQQSSSSESEIQSETHSQMAKNKHKKQFQMPSAPQSVRPSKPFKNKQDFVIEQKEIMTKKPNKQTASNRANKSGPRSDVQQEQEMPARVITEPSSAFHKNVGGKNISKQFDNQYKVVDPFSNKGEEIENKQFTQSNDFDQKIGQAEAQQFQKKDQQKNTEKQNTKQAANLDEQQHRQNQSPLRDNQIKIYNTQKQQNSDGNNGQRVIKINQQPQTAKNNTKQQSIQIPSTNTQHKTAPPPPISPSKAHAKQTHPPAPQIATKLNKYTKQISQQLADDSVFIEMSRLLQNFEAKKQGYLKNAQELSSLCQKNREKESNKIQLINDMLTKLEEQNIKLKSILQHY